MRAPRLVVSLILAVLAVPSTAAAQRDGFLAAWVELYQALPGAYGDEGPRLAAPLEKMTAALAAWDREIRDTESQLQARLKGADANTALEVHAIARKFARSLNVSVYLQDERLSSVEAEQNLRAAGHEPGKVSALVDSEAAAVILRDFLVSSQERILVTSVKQPL